MGLAYEDIIGSDIFTFVIGPNGKEYNIHGTAVSRLSKPLDVLINGNMREAKEKCVKWPDVDEKTFVRFTQWAYTETYVTEEPEILLDPSLIGDEILPIGAQASPEGKEPERPLYSLATAISAQSPKKDCCWNRNCASYGKSNSKHNYQAACLACSVGYLTSACASCNSVYTECASCGPMSRTPRQNCQNINCCYGYNLSHASMSQATCLRCRTVYATKICPCGSAFNDCGTCADLIKETALPKRLNLIYKFLDDSGTAYPTSASVFSPRKNTEGCEDYTDVFLCHAKLYVMADTYDIPDLKQLSLYRLHATLKEFTLYPSRMNDIAMLAKYVFENTVPEDKIRDMITLYYACIIEDAWKHDGLKSVIDEVPDFAFGLISKMSDRLA